MEGQDCSWTQKFGTYGFDDDDNDDFTNYKLLEATFALTLALYNLFTRVVFIFFIKMKHEENYEGAFFLVVR